MSNDPKLSSIRQIAITVSNVDTALRFYCDVLGLPLIFRANPKLAFLNAGGVRLMLTTPQGAGPIGHNSRLQTSSTRTPSLWHAVLPKSTHPHLQQRYPIMSYGLVF